MNKKAITWYLILAFAFSWVLFLLPLLLRQAPAATQTTAAIQTQMTQLLWAVAMWGPGLGALLVTRFVVREPLLSTLGLNRLGDKKAYLWAWLLPTVLALITAGLTVLFGLGKLDLTFSAYRQIIIDAGGPATINVQGIVLTQALFAVTLAPFINVLFALGEELGWRGFLLPRLLPLGTGKAIVISGVIWGVWHAPAIAQGHNYPGYPVLGIFLMTGFTVLLGTILSWLYLRTGSVWAPALGHGAINAVAGMPMLALTGVDMAWGGTIASVTGWIPMAIFVAWLVWSGRLRQTAPAVTTEPMLVSQPEEG